MLCANLIAHSWLQSKSDHQLQPSLSLGSWLLFSDGTDVKAGMGDEGDFKSRNKAFLTFLLGEKVLLNIFVFYLLFIYFFKGCPKELKEKTFGKYKAELVLLFVLVVFYLTLIIFTFVSTF